ncbi:MAG TPA: M24 family metallopeptidase [Oculatellaceae cyanobacterium]
MATIQTQPTVKKFQLTEVQNELKSQGIEGWLFYYFHENDPLALRILGLDGDSHFYSRRWFYFVPATGTPVKLVHRIEQNALDSLPGSTEVYLGWKQLEDKLAFILAGNQKIAMQYSPRGAVPYVSKVDGGLIEVLHGLKKTIVSSGDLIQKFESVWSSEQLKTHIEAGELLRQIVFEAFGEIKRLIASSIPVNEYEIQQFIMRRFDENGLTTNSPPIVAVNQHSGSPHYQPTSDSHAPIKSNDFVLLDIWAKKKTPTDAVYADITWTGYVGEEVPEKYEQIFQIVKGARDAGLEKVRTAVAAKQTLHGFEVDNATREFIEKKGYGQYFVHRTGHSIGMEVHGNGANIDNLETKDERKLIPNTGFSIEPGIYLEEFGVRSEIDVYVGEAEVLVAGQPIQTTVIPIMTL